MSDFVKGAIISSYSTNLIKLGNSYSMLRVKLLSKHSNSETLYLNYRNS